MKKVLFVATILLGSLIGYSQCTPNGPTGNPGVTPPPDSIPCMERGVFYQQILQVENYDSFTIQGFTIKVNFARIDSIKNFPCGISWETDTTNNTYGPGETGCIRVFGTTTDAVGQYPLEIYMTMSINLPFLGDQEASGEINSLIQQLVDLVGQLGGTIPFPIPELRYFTRLIETGDPCPQIDSTSNARGSGATCPPFSVSVTGGTSLCAGGSLALNATSQNSSGPASAVTYNWSPGGATTQSINVSAAGVYSVIANDGSTTATSGTTVTQSALPVAAFTTSNPNTGNFTFTSTSTNATSYAWNFADPGSGAANTSALPSPSHTYTANGTYDVRLIVTNICGTDTVVNPVTVIGVFINPIKTDNVSLSLYPNPNTGTFEIDLVAKEQNENYELKIFDVEGKMVYSETITTNNNKVHKSLQLDNLDKGIYTVNLNSGTTAYIQKLVIF